MAIARSFRDLNVYRKARETAQEIFGLSRNFPPEERYSLTDQIRRSSRAVKAMTQSWLDDARNSAYLSPSDYDEPNSKCVEIDCTDDFCKHPAATDYRTGPRVEEDESIGK